MLLVFVQSVILVEILAYKSFVLDYHGSHGLCVIMYFTVEHPISHVMPCLDSSFTGVAPK